MSDKVLWGLWYANEQGQPDGGRWYLDYFGRPCFSYDRRLVAAHAAARNVGDAEGRFLVCSVGPDGCPIPPCTCDAEEYWINGLNQFRPIWISAFMDQMLAEDKAFLMGTSEPIGILNSDEDAPFLTRGTAPKPCDCPTCDFSRKVAQAAAEQEDNVLLGTGDGVPVGILNLEELVTPVGDLDTDEWANYGARQITYQFLNLPHHVRIDICRSLDLPVNLDAADCVAEFIPAFREIKERKEWLKFDAAVKMCRAIAQAAEDSTFLMGDVRPEPSPRGIQPYSDDEPPPHAAYSEIGEFNRDPVTAVDDDGNNVSVDTDLSARQITYQFLDLPHYVRVGICQALDLPMDLKASSSVAQFAPSLRHVKQKMKLDLLREAVIQADQSLDQTA